MAKDVDLFKVAMAGVTPLKGRKAATAAKPAPSVEPRSQKRPVAAPAVTKAEPPANLAEIPFDRGVDRALSRGRRSPESTLDLHGMTLVAAERAVGQFLAEAAAEGRRVVLIVTGKGARLDSGRVFGGRIRAEFLGWLDRADNRALVAGARPAHPRHGGSGAFYVLLRRRSSASSRSLRATPQR